MTRTRLLLAWFALLSVAGAAQAPPPASTQDTISISGRVIDGGTGTPIPGATVAAAGPSGQFSVSVTGGALQLRGPHMAETDHDGAFTLPNVPVGKVMLGASKEGYSFAFHGQLGPEDAASTQLGVLDLTTDGRHPPFVIKLWPPASIRGMVVDDVGDPVVAATVKLLRRRPLGTGSMWSGGATARTDDRGQYRLLNVTPGDYVVAVIAPAGASPAPAAFYPDATEIAAAMTVRVSGSDVRDGINVIARRRPAATSVTLAGRLIGPAERIANASVRLVPVDSLDPTGQFEGRPITASSDGAFAFPNAAPGKYRLSVTSFPVMHTAPAMTFIGSGSAYSLTNLPTGRGEPQPPLVKLPDEDTFWADMTIDLDRSIADLQVPLRRGARIRGRVEFDMTRPAPSETQRLSSALIIVQALERSFAVMPQSRLEADGSFTSVGLPPGSYAVSGVAQSWFPSDAPLEGPSVFVTSVRVNREERLGEAIQLGMDDLSDVVVTVTDKKMEVAGTVSDAQGKPAPLARVMLFPRQVSQRLPLLSPPPRLVQHVVLDHTGRFTTTVRRAGEYLIAAISTVPSDWFSPEFLESLAPIATRLDIALGEKKTIDLRVRPRP